MFANMFLLWNIASVVEKTIFEKIISREIPANIVFENDIAVIIRDINPQAPVHVLIIPKRRIDRIEAAQDGDVELLGKLLIMARDFAKSHNLTGFRLVINNGKQAGETAPHLHIHLLSDRLMGWPPG
jgi:histidine triad (HIT) family protein